MNDKPKRRGKRPPADAAVPAPFVASKVFPIYDDPADDRTLKARKIAGQITAPESNAWRVLLASEGNSAFVDLLDTAGSLEELRRLAEQVNGGDMRRPEAMLLNQAVALETLFTRLIERGIVQTGLPQFEAFVRLGLKAQAQSRLAIEALATLKNGPFVLARGQFNVANGPQQVNNATAPRAGDSETAPSRLSSP